MSGKGWMTLLAMAVVLSAGGLLLVWPAYREHGEIEARLVDLRSKVSALTDRTLEVERLAIEVDRLRSHIESDLLEIPDKPDIARLIRELSTPVDGFTIRDQTFASGNATDAVPGEDLRTQAMPVTVEMEATFRSVFSLIRGAETTDRLVRIASLRIDRAPPLELEGPLLLRATVGLDAIFEPVFQQEQ